VLTLVVVRVLELVQLNVKIVLHGVFGLGDVYGTTRKVSSGFTIEYLFANSGITVYHKVTKKWYKMFDSFMVSQNFQEASIIIFFMVYLLSQD